MINKMDLTSALLLLLLFVLFSNINKSKCDLINNEIEECYLPDNLKKEIASYAPIARRIINETVYGKFKGSTYNNLANFVDKYGYRIAPSKNLEDAIDFMINQSIAFNLENVHGEEVIVPHWIRGEESAQMLRPHLKKLSILGLGGSVGTQIGGITAEAVVVSSFDELELISEKVKGKIVVFAQNYVSYPITVAYRRDGASKAAKYGAVAALIRSVTPFSLNTPHTGMQSYADGVVQIPAACITVEDAHMLRRIYERGTQIVIELKMDARYARDGTSRNTIAEIEGDTKKDKVVIVSGHLDSWDVGQGAMDDGGGAFLSWNSLVILKQLNLRPKRTLRAILWTAEEEGLIGAVQYYKKHKNEIPNYNIVMESDIGTFNPLGLTFFGSDQAACILKEILKLMKSINATTLQKSADVGSDITVFIKDGVPAASLLNENERYFWYHHSEADMLDVEDPSSLDRGLALWATVSYIIADLSTDIPRE